jgi:hypothetical protein
MTLPGHGDGTVSFLDRVDSGTEDITMRADLVVGSRFPDLVLPDHRRNSVQLSALGGGYPLIVSFYRGYW